MSEAEVFNTVENGKKEKLNRLCGEYCSLKQEDAAAKMALKQEIFKTAFELFPRYADYFGWFFEEYWKRYDHEKYNGNAYNYFLYGLGKSKKKQRDKDWGVHRRTIKNSETGEKGTIRITNVPIYTENEEGEMEPIDNEGLKTPDGSTEIIENDDVEDIIIAHFGLIINFWNHFKGHAANDNKFRWYQIFYTEDTTCAVKKELGVHPRLLKHEREIFQAIRKTYLDFYMKHECRTLDELFNTHLKTIAEILPGHARGNEEIPLPLQAKISVAYLTECEKVKATEGSRSQQHKTYLDTFKTILGDCLSDGFRGRNSDF